jgi:hypothetical protein
MRVQTDDLAKEINAEAQNEAGACPRSTANQKSN